jgi:succinate dehydrogenase / fumarate reductase cytochrome b subunit
MSSLAPSKRGFPTNTIRGDPGLLSWLRRVIASTVGGKLIVALSGLGLTGFVIVHMIGNLQIFAGRDAINTYAQFLKDHGGLLWFVRVSLLTIFLLHVIWAVRLKLKAKAARPVPYVYEDTVQASLASRTMLLSGLVILFFILFHLAHYTLGWIKPAEVAPGVHVNYLSLRDPLGRHDVYNMMVFGFREPIVAILYLAAQVFLLLHLSHGVQSAFQSLGINSPRWQPTIRGLGWTIALAVVGGNVAIVLGVWLGWAPPLGPILY